MSNFFLINLFLLLAYSSDCSLLCKNSSILVRSLRDDFNAIQGVKAVNAFMVPFRKETLVVPSQTPDKKWSLSRINVPHELSCAVKELALKRLLAVFESSTNISSVDLSNDAVSHHCHLALDLIFREYFSLPTDTTTKNASVISHFYFASFNAMIYFWKRMQEKNLTYQEKWKVVMLMNISFHIGGTFVQTQTYNRLEMAAIVNEISIRCGKLWNMWTFIDSKNSLKTVPKVLILAMIIILIALQVTILILFLPFFLKHRQVYELWYVVFINIINFVSLTVSLFFNLLYPHMDSKFSCSFMLFVQAESHSGLDSRDLISAFLQFVIMTEKWLQVRGLTVKHVSPNAQTKRIARAKVICLLALLVFLILYLIRLSAMLNEGVVDNDLLYFFDLVRRYDNDKQNLYCIYYLYTQNTIFTDVSKIIEVTLHVTVLVACCIAVALNIHSIYLLRLAEEMTEIVGIRRTHGQSMDASKSFFLQTILLTFVVAGIVGIAVGTFVFVMITQSISLELQLFRSILGFVYMFAHNCIYIFTSKKLKEQVLKFLTEN